jgi:hypothetical protein
MRVPLFLSPTICDQFSVFFFSGLTQVKDIPGRFAILNSDNRYGTDKNRLTLMADKISLGSIILINEADHEKHTKNYQDR